MSIIPMRIHINLMDLGCILLFGASSETAPLSSWVIDLASEAGFAASGSGFFPLRCDDLLLDLDLDIKDPPITSP